MTKQLDFSSKQSAARRYEAIRTVTWKLVWAQEPLYKYGGPKELIKLIETLRNKIWAKLHGKEYHVKKG